MHRRSLARSLANVRASSKRVAAARELRLSFIRSRANRAEALLMTDPVELLRNFTSAAVRVARTEKRARGRTRGEKVSLPAA